MYVHTCMHTYIHTNIHTNNCYDLMKRYFVKYSIVHTMPPNFSIFEFSLILHTITASEDTILVILPLLKFSFIPLFYMYTFLSTINLHAITHKNAHI